MGENVYFDNINVDKVTKWFKTIWSKSFFIVIALLIGIFIGESAVEKRIIGDCKYLNSFRIDHLSYACNRKVNEQ